MTSNHTTAAQPIAVDDCNQQTDATMTDTEPTQADPVTQQIRPQVSETPSSPSIALPEPRGAGYIDDDDDDDKASTTAADGKAIAEAVMTASASVDEKLTVAPEEVTPTAADEKPVITAVPLKVSDVRTQCSLRYCWW